MVNVPAWVQVSWMESCCDPSGASGTTFSDCVDERKETVVVELDEGEASPMLSVLNVKVKGAPTATVMAAGAVTT
jgi:hypothetical protein